MKYFAYVDYDLKVYGSAMITVEADSKKKAKEEIARKFKKLVRTKSLREYDTVIMEMDRGELLDTYSEGFSITPAKDIISSMTIGDIEEEEDQEEDS